MKNISITTADSTIQNARSQTEEQHGQLDLSFSAATACARPSWRRRQLLRSRASWWFQQMRRAVDGPIERPGPPARPEQGTLDLRRPTEVAVK